MRTIIVTLFALWIGTAGAVDPCAEDVAPLLNTLFSSLGHDCNKYHSLYEADGKYYHQHDGFKRASELMDSCKGYAAFCPGNKCRFLQNGEPVKVARDNSCHVLVPYLWAQIPASKENLEPHTGWEYLILNPAGTSPFKFRIKYFAEIETSYSVAFNWAEPAQTPALVAESALHLLSQKNSASKGECDSPIAPTLTKFFDDKSTAGNRYRQQGDAVLLAAGGICHVAVPYAAQVGATLKTGHFIFTLKPEKGAYVFLNDAVEFPRTVI